MIEFRNISKRFGNVIANDRISCGVRAGEVHAFLGENGAGKTTLMKILSGCLHPDDGELSISGKTCLFRSPLDAQNSGIGMVHQNLSLIPSLTVMENLAMGLKQSFIVRKFDLKSRINELSSASGIKILPDAHVWELSHGQKQLVEIFKLLFLGARVLILDEPTTSLTPHETEAIFTHLGKLKSQGHTILLVTHKLSDVMAYADTVTVLRSGRVIGSVKASETTERDLAAMMVGGNDGQEKFSRSWKVGDEFLKVESISSKHVHHKRTLKDISFNVGTGEIFGIAGVSGNGQDELVEVLTGARKHEGGSFTFNGNDNNAEGSPPVKIRYIPEDRLGVGTAPSLSISDNLMLRHFNQPPFSKLPFPILVTTKMYEEAKQKIEEFRIKAGDPAEKLATLSGGNIQRVILARELADSPDLVIAVNPTSGLDVAGIGYVHTTLALQASKGAAIIVISENLDELLLICHRIMVLCDGASMGIFDTSNADREEIGMCMGGHTC